MKQPVSPEAPLPQPPTPVQPQPQSNKNKLIFLIGIILLLTSISSVLYYLGQNSTQTPIISSPVPVAVSTVPSPDEVINWKTYRNEGFGFEFNYPSDWPGPFEHEYSTQSARVYYQIDFGGELRITVKDEGYSSPSTLEENLPKNPPIIIKALDSSNERGIVNYIFTSNSIIYLDCQYSILQDYVAPLYSNCLIRQASLAYNTTTETIVDLTGIPQNQILELSDYRSSDHSLIYIDSGINDYFDTSESVFPEADYYLINLQTRTYSKLSIDQANSRLVLSDDERKRLLEQYECSSKASFYQDILQENPNQFISLGCQSLEEIKSLL